MPSVTVEQAPEALGTVVEEGRGSLPFTLLHGEPLVSHAAWALREAGIRMVDFPTTWEALASAEEPVVFHDALCPGTPSDFLVRCVATAVQREAVVIGVRPVTDTVKVVTDDTLGETVDRTGLRAVASPVVLPATVVRSMDALPSTRFDALATDLARRFPVVSLTAPPQARRVATHDDVRLLEALVEPF